MQGRSIGQGSPRTAAGLLASGFAVMASSALLGGIVSVVVLFAGMTLFIAGAVTLGRLPRRP